MPITPPFLPKSRRRIEILAFPNVQLLDVSGPLQVFATANDLAGATKKPCPYELAVVAGEADVCSSAGLGLVTHRLPDPASAVDTLLVAGGYGVNSACTNPDLIGWIAARSVVARRVASVCSGAFLLATASLLNGRRAVTHWGRCAEFALRFPGVRLEPDAIFINDGPIWTSAGVTAGIDLALAMVEADLGRDTALAVARELVVFVKRPGGQSQFSAILASQHGDARFERLHVWIGENLRSDLSVVSLAGMVGMSQRSFVRHFAKATATTPARAIERIRIDAARQMLDQGRPVKHVATACGFGSDETMRRSFLRLLSVPPQVYQERFSSLSQDNFAASPIVSMLHTPTPPDKPTP